MGHVQDLEKIKFDKRVADFNVKRGHITKEQVKKHLEALPDYSANAQAIEIESDRMSPEKPGSVHNLM